jgi:hypothetical protein
MRARREEFRDRAQRCASRFPCAERPNVLGGPRDTTDPQERSHLPRSTDESGEHVAAGILAGHSRSPVARRCLARVVTTSGSSSGAAAAVRLSPLERARTRHLPTARSGPLWRGPSRGQSRSPIGSFATVYLLLACAWTSFRHGHALVADRPMGEMPFRTASLLSPMRVPW